MSRKILFAVSEANPFIATGGLGDVAGALPAAIKKNDDSDVRVIMPFYKDISEKYMSQLEYICYHYVSLAWRNQYCGIFRGEANGITYYFIDNEYYFKRGSCYGHYDDGERFAFFCKAVLEVLPIIDFIPDVIHAHDWQTALVPVYLKTIFSGNDKYRNIKSVFTIHNIEYQGQYDMAILGDVFSLGPWDSGIVEYDGCINLLKGAMEVADAVTTVSPTYAQELKNPFYSHGLTPEIERISYKMNGILNGIDTNFYNPDIDKCIYKNYNINSIENKYENKRKLQEELNMSADENIPLVAVVSRLVGHKGMDIIRMAADEMMAQNIKLVVLGTGDAEYENFFRDLAYRYGGKAVSMIEFNSAMARKIYAAADLFLMPSKSEPCGLAQMICSVYGAVPIVRETGGLKDSVHDCSLGEGNGFTFAEYTAYNVVNALQRALSVYYDKPNWNKLVKAVMSVDFSWNKSAGEYVKMYDRLL